MPGGELSSYISHSMPGTRFQMWARHTLLPTQETVWYFLETTGHFLLLGLAWLYVLPSTNSLCSFPIPWFVPGTPGLSSHPVAWTIWLVAALLGKALTNTSGSSHFPSNCPCSFRVFFSTLMLIMNFFQCQSYSYNQFVWCFPLVTTKVHYFYTWHHFICNHSCCFC